MDFLGTGVRHVADLQVRAVGGQAGTGLACDARRDVTAQRRGSEEHDLRLVLRDQSANDLRVRNGREVFQARIVDRVHRVHAVRDEIFRHFADFKTGQHRADFHAETVRQFARLAA